MKTILSLLKSDLVSLGVCRHQIHNRNQQKHLVPAAYKKNMYLKESWCEILFHLND